MPRLAVYLGTWLTHSKKPNRILHLSPAVTLYNLILTLSAAFDFWATRTLILNVRIGAVCRNYFQLYGIEITHQLLYCLIIGPDAKILPRSTARCHLSLYPNWPCAHAILVLMTSST